TCPVNITHTADAGQCSASLDPGKATATDNCHVASIGGVRSDNKPLTDPYPVGTTTITWTATDDAGNSSTCSQTISVTDNEKPVITCPANITHNADPGTCPATGTVGTAVTADGPGVAPAG